MYHQFDFACLSYITWFVLFVPDLTSLRATQAVWGFVVTIVNISIESFLINTLQGQPDHYQGHSHTKDATDVNITSIFVDIYIFSVYSAANLTLDMYILLMEIWFLCLKLDRVTHSLFFDSKWNFPRELLPLVTISVFYFIACTMEVGF